ncbi:DUF6053 domain-containing protein [Lysobacter enzymogenes]|uniref:DUF6053 domain-containing protein n=1 Tax=Lysobacter enzymogenes TaxID=69 RepID=UPI003D18B85F
MWEGLRVRRFCVCGDAAIRAESIGAEAPPTEAARLRFSRGRRSRNSADGRRPQAPGLLHEHRLHPEPPPQPLSLAPCGRI